MIFSDLEFKEKQTIYIQIKNHIEDMILKGMLPRGSKLPSTRELSKLLKVSRNSVIMAYEELEAEGVLYTVKGKGTFVSENDVCELSKWSIDWNNKINKYARMAEDLDINKNELQWEKGMISFKSIAPEGDLFDIDEFKKAFLNRISLEGHKLLNYGYAQGYKPLIEYLLSYMENKGVSTKNKDIIITNGFTEGLDMILSSLTVEGDNIICENPTHNTAIKLMKIHGLNVIGVEINNQGIDIDILENKINSSKPKCAYLIPSYHNPTGTVMQPEKRYKIYNILKKAGVPIIEDGFNEELLYTGSHVSPLAALEGDGNGVIYIGSFSKILFPGIRLGWILADKRLVNILESVKRCRTIHSSVIDQAIFYEYLQSGAFEKYMKKVRKFYKEKYEFILKCIKKYLPIKEIWGEGGLHIFIKLDGLNAREVLTECYARGVIFTPGDIFYIDDSGSETLRLGISRVAYEDIEIGIKIIGEVVKDMTR